MPATHAAVADTARGRKSRRGPLTRQQILDASLRLFSERGFARTSVREIAQAAGITDAAIYYHFASKRELFEALVEERGFTTALQELEHATELLESGEASMGPREAITAVATGALDLMYVNRDLMKVLMVEAMAEDPAAAEEYRTLVERWERAEAGILRHYAKRGLLRTEAVDELAKQLVVTVIGVFADYLMLPKDEPPPEETPPDLRRHVEAAMHHIAQGIT